MATRNTEGSKQLTTRQKENVRANLARSASAIGNRVAQCALGEQEMSPTELKAAGMVLDKVVPSLQSIDHNDLTEREPTTEAALLERLGAWLSSNPKLIEVLRARGVTVEPEPENKEKRELSEKKSTNG